MPPMKENLEIVDDIMDQVTQTDFWDSIQRTNPMIKEADDHLSALLNKLKATSSENLVEKVRAAAWELSNAFCYPAILYGMRVAQALQEVTLDPIGAIAYLRELAQAEKDGRLVMLPCRVGDVVYEANKQGFISTYKVISIHLSAYSTRIVWELLDGVYSNLNGFEASTLGKTVFLTREDAEAALEKREADNERI